VSERERDREAGEKEKIWGERENERDDDRK
jgi:hypothetical protein